MNANKFRRYFFSKKLLFPVESIDSVPDTIFKFIHLLCTWHEQRKKRTLNRDIERLDYANLKKSPNLAVLSLFSQILHFWRHLEFYRDGLFSSNVSPGGFPGGAVVKNRVPMQGTQVQALAREDPTGRGAAKPVRHNYWACALEPMSHNYWAHMPRLLKPTCLEPVLRNKRSHHNEKPTHRNE